MLHNFDRAFNYQTHFYLKYNKIAMKSCMTTFKKYIS